MTARATRALAGGLGAVVGLGAGAALLIAACADQQLITIHAIGGQPDGGDISCSQQMIGFATQGRDGGTTGGAAGETVTVETVADLQTRAGEEAPLTIRVNGMFTLTSQIRVKSDKTIVGVGTGSGLSGGGLNLTDASNVIVRNLTIEKVIKNDAISIAAGQNVWVDHCELSSDRDHDREYYDGLIDITHGADFVTVSWTQFRDHVQTSFIGGSDDNQLEDTDHLRVTFEHNLFLRTESHNPSIRFGMLHALNNYYLTIDGGGIFSRMNAQVLAEGNYFDGVNLPLTTHYESPIDGFLTDENNLFVNPLGDPAIGQTASWRPTYDWSAQRPADVPATVSRCAGVGKLNL